MRKNTTSVMHPDLQRTHGGSRETQLDQLIEEMQAKLGETDNQKADLMFSGGLKGGRPEVTPMRKKTAKVEAHVEPEVKKQAEVILASLGIPMSHAINIYLRQIISKQGIPFEIKV